MDAWDMAVRGVEARIDLETRQRNQEYIKKLQDLDKEQRDQIDQLGYGMGTTHPFQVRRAAIEQQHQKRCQEDEIKFQGYWDSISTPDQKNTVELEQKDVLQDARTRWDGLNNAFKGQIPPTVLRAFEDTYSRDILHQLVQQDKEKASQNSEPKPDIFDQMLQKEKERQRQAANQNPVNKTGDIFDQMLQTQRRKNGQSQ